MFVLKIFFDEIFQPIYFRFQNVYPVIAYKTKVSDKQTQ